jgi:ribosomal protein S18 acetylase RimI-like enzyme
MSLVLRPVHPSDLLKGHVELLSHLTETGPRPSQERYNHIISRSASNGFLLVIESLPVILPQYPNVDANSGELIFLEHYSSDCSSSEGVIVGCATLIVEEKLIHNCGKVGHIEDVVVSPTMRGKDLGKKLVNKLLELAQRSGCYKVVLDCKPDNAGFYEKIGFFKSDQHMRYNFTSSSL